MSKILRSLVGYLRNIDEIYLLLKLRLDVRHAEKQVPNEPHLAFCFTMLRKFSRKYAFVIQQLPTHLRNAVCVFYLVLRALDTVEDDMTIPMEDKIPTLDGSADTYPRLFLGAGGTGEFKVLMDRFHNVSTALLEHKKRYQEEIEDTTKRTGVAMAKFLFKEVETIDDYEEYCNHMAGFLVVALSKLFHASGLEDSAADDRLSKSVGLFLQKTNITRDYLEDINATPTSRKLWPRQIWSKYVNKLEDLKYGSAKAVQCLNDMVTNALTHAEDCLRCMSTLQHPAIIRFYAVPTIIAMGTLAMCYNNVEVFRGEVKMRRGLSAKVIDRTRGMPDVYGAFFDFSCIFKSKVDMSDPNATKTLRRLDMIQKCCKESGLLSKSDVAIYYIFHWAGSILFGFYNRTWHIIKSKPKYNPAMIVPLFLIVCSFVLAHVCAHKSRN